MSAVQHCSHLIGIFFHTGVLGNKADTPAGPMNIWMAAERRDRAGSPMLKVQRVDTGAFIQERLVAVHLTRRHESVALVVPASRGNILSFCVTLLPLRNAYAEDSIVVKRANMIQGISPHVDQMVSN